MPAGRSARRPWAVSRPRSRATRHTRASSRRSGAGRRHERGARRRQPRRLPCARAASGFEPRLLTGEQEAATTFAGVCSRAPGGEAVSADGTLVVDVGGGSTELVLGAAGGVAWSRSLQAGCVRMTERVLGEDVVASRRPRRLCGGSTAAGGRAGRGREATRRAIAVAGTATTLAAIQHGGYDAEAVHGARITREQTRALEQRLAR